jgi:hypothetical protein
MTATKKRKARYVTKYLLKSLDKNAFMKEYEVVSIRFVQSEKHDKANLIKTDMTMENFFTNGFVYNNTEYVHDSLLLTNFNIYECHKGHDICGVTCGNERFMYNGWLRHTRDAAMQKTTKTTGANNTYPCELMKYDWLSNQPDFCLNPSMCKLDNIDTNKELKRNVCFNISKGPRTYLMVNKKFMFNEVDVPSVTTALAIDPQEKQEEKVKKTKGKECPQGKIVNPATGRCVKIDGAIGKKILSKK